MIPAAPPLSHAPVPELTLEGPVDALLRSLDALRQVCDPTVPASILELGLIESLRLTEGEAWLRFVSLGMSCPLSDLTADAAFRAIQSALPDTDIYLSHDHAVEWSPRRASVALRRRLGWAETD
ncbi:iron-sulfur cluster assembly protein [Sphaerotilus sp.]|uniref:iron-sulfur cluster assembly protein n=1 Tax=Sphaerotilus sp. TaxID=2093942 RepID=UPI002ACE1AB3|nr:iron-sulfur cluster assembly protein [Sphaerotilus sp.]MDZ7857345.1 iron-sulfur cluster assembly protein [Sphaerotilus sp.]